MNKCPKVGDRVKLVKDHRYFPCTGIVTKIYPQKVCLTSEDDSRWDDPDFYGEYGGLKPEREWRVTMKVDVLPKDWAYLDNDKFCPSVYEVEKANG